ncbi:hypothetical protein LCGC14_1583810, partial [marine sediment metagenome]
MPTNNWPTKPLAVASLHLDAKNPRLGRETTSRAPREIIQYLFDHDKAMEVAQSIATRGYFPNEPLLAIKEDGHFVIVEGNRRLAEAADVVFLAVKPQQMGTVCEGLRGGLDNCLVVSIAAGVRLDDLAAGLGPDVRLVRVMPNTPCLVGRGAAGYCLGKQAGQSDGRLVKRLLEASGMAFEVPEKLLDAVTGLSGSGPAFV